MANVMLTSETAKDPNKPFKLRVEDVCTKFDVRCVSCALSVYDCCLVLEGACDADMFSNSFSSLHEQALVSECLLLVQSEEQFPSSEGSDLTSVEDQVVKKLEQFNSVCDELYKEILRRKEKLLNLMEKSPKNVDLHRQIQTAGNMVQVIGDFRHFLETGVVKPDKSS